MKFQLGRNRLRRGHTKKESVTHHQIRDLILTIFGLWGIFASYDISWKQMNSWDYLQTYLGTNTHNDLGFNITITNIPLPQHL